MKHVYIIQNLANGAFKIGTSIHPAKRVKQLQTGNDAPFKLIGSYPSEYALKIEKTLHNMFSYCKGEGEWVNISLVEALLFEEKCKKIEETIISLKDSGNVFI